MSSGAAHMPLPIWARPPEAAGEPHPHVRVLVGREPRLCLHLGLRHHRPGKHRGVDLVAGAVEEAGVDEDEAVASGVDAAGQVERRTPLLVHQAELDRRGRQAEQLLHGGEQLARDRDLVGPVLLGLHGIDRAGARVAQPRAAVGVVQPGEGRHERVQDPLRDRLPLGVEHGVGEHVVPDVPDEEQRPAGEQHRLAVAPDVGAVVGHRAGEGAAALRHLGLAACPS